MEPPHVPGAWCPDCGEPLKPSQVVLRRCPACGSTLETVVVDRETARAIVKLSADELRALTLRGRTP